MEISNLKRHASQEPKLNYDVALIRHGCAHVLAQAVQELYPETQVTIGPSIQDGFYYDFFREKSFTPDDFSAIEARMHQIVDANVPFVKEVWSREEAIKFFAQKNESYKVEIIQDLPENEQITIYRQGNWLDLCRGPHVSSTGQVGHAFKLMKIAGAYWRGNSENQMLQRIYGTAWSTQEELDQYLFRLEEAEKRDHRRIGKDLELFHMQEEAVGMIFWHPKGWAMWKVLEDYIRRRVTREDYKEVKTPSLYDSSLFKASGHWDHFSDAMFKFTGENDRVHCLKPMNCPAHVQIYNKHVRSYRDLPIRLAEFGSCHRNEPSGSLHGIMRVRNFTQDDAHIFCREDQIISESLNFFKLQLSVYHDLGFKDENIQVKLSLRPVDRAGREDLWDKAEDGLREALSSAGLQWEELPGEGAFYGPKAEFHLIDAIGRTWQCGTLQLDFVLPERLNAEFVAEDGKKHRPVMLHRALLGSMERFMGILIEHYAGKFPLWLAPTQCVIATVTSDADAYALNIVQKLKEKGIRAEVDVRNEKIGYKIREHIVRRTPVLFVVGKRDVENNQVVVRYAGSEEQLTLSLTDAVQKIVSQSLPPDLAR